MAMMACLLGAASGALGQVAPGAQQSLLPLPQNYGWQQPARGSELSQVYGRQAAAVPAYTSPTPYARHAVAPGRTSYAAWQGDTAPTPPMPAEEPEAYSPSSGAFDEALSGPGMGDDYAGSCASGACCDQDCSGAGPYAGLGGGCGGFGTPCGPKWSARFGALIMTRDNPNGVWLSFNNTNINTRLLSTRDADVDNWKGGFEVSLSRMIGTNHAISVTYWTLDRFEEAGSTRSEANQLNTPIDLNNVTLDGANVDTFFDAAREHRIERTNEFHNIEINLIHMPMQAYGNSAVSLNWLAGIRYFRFDEGLQFGSVSFDNEFGSNGGLNEAYLDIDVLNNLVGFQLGSDGRFQVARSLALLGGIRAGIYGNHIQHRTQLLRGDGFQGLLVNSSENDVSLLGEINLTIEWQPARWFAGYLGYRAVFVSGVALSDNQIPIFLADTGGISDIDSNGELILHGITAGGQFMW